MTAVSGRRLGRWVFTLAAAAVLVGCASGESPPTELQVVAVAPRKFPVYERSCSPGQGCVFGPAWTDATTCTEWSRDGCDTATRL